MDIAQQVGLWTLITLLIIIAIHPVLQRIGILPDKWKDDVKASLDIIKNIITNRNFIEKIEDVGDVKNSIDKILNMHLPKGDRYKSDLVCECNAAGEKPEFKAHTDILFRIVSLLDSIQKQENEVFVHFSSDIETIKRIQKEQAERIIETNTTLIKVMEALLRKLGE